MLRTARAGFLLDSADPALFCQGAHHEERVCASEPIVSVTGSMFAVKAIDHCAYFVGTERKWMMI